jgi:hypothetical protein
MDNYTPDYIELAKNKIIQDLRQPDCYLLVGDRYYDPDWYIEYEVKVSDLDTCIDNTDLIWLPSGDQLDKELEIICKAMNYNLHINFNVVDKYHSDYWSVGVCRTANLDVPIYVESNCNPLIAKIKLLIKLLEA